MYYESLYESSNMQTVRWAKELYSNIFLSLELHHIITVFNIKLLMKFATLGHRLLIVNNNSYEANGNFLSRGT